MTRGRPGARPPARRPPATPDDARGVALEVLERVRTTDAYANLVLPSAIRRAGLDARDAGLASELTYGTLRMQGTLDWVIGLFCDRPLDALDGSLLDRLRLGTYQLLYTNVPDHAAVAETVRGTQPSGARGFVNAVLRRIASQREAIPWPTPEGALDSYLAVRYAHPRWLVGMWLSELGPQDAEGLCEAGNTFPGITIRVNTSRATPEAVASRLRSADLTVLPGRWSAETLVVHGGGTPASWPGFTEGAFAIQDEASVLAVEALGLRPSQTAVDLCAGPGGKTTHLTSLTGPTGRVLAIEPHAHRARLVSETLRRVGGGDAGGRALVVRADGTQPPVRPDADAVLIDAPCSGLGVLRRRPEARWRVRAGAIEPLATLQLRLLRAGAGLLRRGGRLVYAVCTVSRRETLDVVDRFCAEVPGITPLEVLPDIPRMRPTAPGTLQLLPHLHGTDGMFIAAFEKG